MGKLVVGLIAGIVLAVGVPLLVVASGVWNVAATRPPGPIENRLAAWARDASIHAHASDAENPLAADPTAAAAGRSHYRANCVVCHGAPGVEPAELASGLNPAPPQLDSQEIQGEEDGELFWVVKHGIRMTGMPAFGPTHSDQDIWRIVAFVRHLPEITPEEREELRAALAFEAHEHADGDGAAGEEAEHEHTEDEGAGEPGHTHAPGEEHGPPPPPPGAR